MTQLTPVREAHRFDEERLAKYLQKQLNPKIQSIDVQQFEGGQSNPTFLIRSVGSDEQRYVLRKQPPGKLLKSAHQVDREYRVMRALRDTAVPVPQMLHVCEDPDIIGTRRRFKFCSCAVLRCFPKPAISEHMNWTQSGKLG